jgi:O-antigen/teichoic acid export membrane protein
LSSLNQNSASETLRNAPRRRSYAHHLTTTAAAQACSVALGVVTGVLAARLLGPEGRGYLAALVLWPMTIVFLVSMGINQAIVYFLGQKTWTISEVWTASTVIGLGQSITAVLVGLVAIPFALHSYSHDVQILCFAVLLATPVIILGGFPANILQGHLDLISFNLIQLSAPATYAIGIIFLAAAHRGSLRNIVIARLLSYIFTLALGYILLLRRTSLRFSWNRGACLSLLRFGGKTELGNISNYVNRSADQLILSLFVPAHELGLYAVAVTVSLAVNFVPQAAGVVALAAGSANPAGAVSVIGKSFRASLVWLLCGCAALFLAAPFLIVGFFGHAYTGSVLACRILLPGAVAIGLNQVLYDGARAMGDPALSSYSEGFATAVTVGALWLLLPRFGFLGAAIASTLAYTGSLCVSLFLYRSRIGIKPAQLLWLPANHRTATLQVQA